MIEGRSEPCRLGADCPPIAHRLPVESPSMALTKPHLSFWQVVNMNVGFFGIQFSFGLQQSNMSPIYRYLGADEASLPLLALARSYRALPPARAPPSRAD